MEPGSSFKSSSRPQLISPNQQRPPRTDVETSTISQEHIGYESNDIRQHSEALVYQIKTAVDGYGDSLDLASTDPVKDDLKDPSLSLKSTLNSNSGNFASEEETLPKSGDSAIQKNLQRQGSSSDSHVHHPAANDFGNESEPLTESDIFLDEFRVLQPISPKSPKRKRPQSSRGRKQPELPQTPPRKKPTTRRMDITVYKIPRDFGGAAYINALDLIHHTSEGLLSKFSDSRCSQSDLDPMILDVFKAYQKQIRSRLTNMIDLLDTNFLVEKHVRKIKGERDALRSKLIEIRQNRINLSAQTNSIRQLHHGRITLLDDMRHADKFLSNLKVLRKDCETKDLSKNLRLELLLQKVELKLELTKSLPGDTQGVYEDLERFRNKLKFFNLSKD